MVSSGAVVDRPTPAGVGLYHRPLPAGHPPAVRRAGPRRALAVLAAALAVLPLGAAGASPPRSEAPATRVVYQLGGEPVAAVWLADRLFVGQGRRVLALDVAIPGQPEVVAISDLLPGDVHDLVAAAGRLYVATEGGLAVLDPGGVGQLAVRRTLLTAERPFALASGERTLYVATGYGGPRVVDLRDPDRPEPVFELRDPTAEGLLASGGRLVVWSGGTLYLYDLARPARPRLRQLLRAPEGRFVAAATDGLWTYVLRSLDGATARLDVLDGAWPATLTSRPMNIEAYAEDRLTMDPVGRRLFVFRGGALQVIDVSEPLRPLPLSLGELGYCHVLVLSGGRALLLTDRDLTELALDGPRPRAEASTRLLPATSRPVLVADGRALSERGIQHLGEDLAPLADRLGPGAWHHGEPLLALSRQAVLARTSAGGQSDARVVDLSDPAAPILSTSLGRVGSAVVAAGYLVLTDGHHDLVVYEVADPGRPRPIGRVDLPLRRECVADLAVSGTLVVVAACGSEGDVLGGPGELFTVDLSTPSRPRILGRLAFAGEAYAAAMVGDHALIGFLDAGAGPARPTLAVVSLADPDAPRVVANWHDHREQFAIDILVHGSYAYVSLYNRGRASVAVLDLRLPEQPREVARLPVGTLMGGLAWWDGALWVAGLDGGLWGFR
jgi:hypothetical protein